MQALRKRYGSVTQDLLRTALLQWHMAVDASGKEYYYNETSQESLWELPEVPRTHTHV